MSSSPHLAIYVIAGIHGALSLAGIALYLSRWRHPVIKNRGFILAVVQSVYSIIHFTILTVRQDDVTYSCLFTYFSTTLLVPFYIFPFLIRTFIMWFRLELNKSKATRKKDSLTISKKDLWIYNHRFFGSTRFEILAFFVFLAIYLIPSMLVYGLVPPDPTLRTCFGPQAYVLMSFIILCLLIVMMFTVGLWNKEDAFFIKQEMRATCLVGLPIFVAWCVTYSLGSGDSIVVFVGLFVLTLVVLYYPVAMIIFGEILEITDSEAEGTPKSSEEGAEDAVPTFEAGSAKFLQYSLQENEVLRQSFEVSAIKCFQMDHLNLYLDVYNFRKNPADLKAAAEALVDEYLRDSSPARVRIDPTVVSEILHGLETGAVGPTLFATVETDTFLHLKKHVYPKWLQTTAIQEALKVVNIKVNFRQTVSRPRWSGSDMFKKNPSNTSLTSRPVLPLTEVKVDPTQ